jgi:hypothetical protein
VFTQPRHLQRWCTRHAAALNRKVMPKDGPCVLQRRKRILNGFSHVIKGTWKRDFRHVDFLQSTPPMWDVKKLRGKVKCTGSELSSKGIVQRILSRVESRLIRSMLVNWRSARFHFWILGTPSQEEHKTIFSGLKIYEIALSDQIDFPAFFRLRKMTHRNLINSGNLTIRCRLCPIRWPYATMSQKITSTIQTIYFPFFYIIFLFLYKFSVFFIIFRFLYKFSVFFI